MKMLLGLSLLLGSAQSGHAADLSGTYRVVSDECRYHEIGDILVVNASKTKFSYGKKDVLGVNGFPGAVTPYLETGIGQSVNAVNANHDEIRTSAAYSSDASVFVYTSIERAGAFHDQDNWFRALNLKSTATGAELRLENGNGFSNPCLLIRQ